jgi:hypothetical protein
MCVDAFSRNKAGRRRGDDRGTVERAAPHRRSNLRVADADHAAALGNDTMVDLGD